jgi:rSAM/selenodomain-associated transferase 1
VIVPSRAVVFVKLPVPGKVKTRLAREIGEEKAASLYRTWTPPFVEMLTQVPNLSTEVCLAVELGDDASIVLAQARQWLAAPVDWGFQEGEGLAERLRRAFENQFEAGWKSVLVVGSDSPQLSEEALTANLLLLGEGEVVLGPAEDGGYYCIGLQQPPGSLFDQVRWSSVHTLEDTLRAAQAQGWKTCLGPPTYDIDTLADLERLLREAPQGRWEELHRILGR